MLSHVVCDLVNTENYTENFQILLRIMRKQIFFYCRVYFHQVKSKRNKVPELFPATSDDIQQKKEEINLIIHKPI